jgi:hypothetical protein
MIFNIDGLDYTIFDHEFVSKSKGFRFCVDLRANLLPASVVTYFGLVI